MQTIEQHFNQLLEPYKGQAIKNTDKNNGRNYTHQRVGILSIDNYHTK
jgi:hypothetical protein